MLGQYFKFYEGALHIVWKECVNCGRKNINYLSFIKEAHIKRLVLISSLSFYNFTTSNFNFTTELSIYSCILNIIAPE